MAIIRQTNKKTGITYVIDSESYWDKEKQQPRSRRKIIGKIDPITGEVVPTNSHQKRRSTVAEPASVSASVNADDEARTDRARIRELEKQVSKLQKQEEALLKELDLLTAKYRD